MIANQAQSTATSAVAGKWRNLAATGAEEKMAALRLDHRGMVRDCTRACEELFGYGRHELVWRPVSMLLPQLAEWELMQNGQPNPSLRFHCRIGRRFQAVTRDGEHFASELFLNLLNGARQGGLSLIVRPVETVAVADGLQDEGG